MGGGGGAGGGGGGGSRGVNFSSPHVKTQLLLAARMARCPLPIADYALDTKSILDNVQRVLSALMDMAALCSALAPVRSGALLSACLTSAVLPEAGPLQLLLPALGGGQWRGGGGGGRSAGGGGGGAAAAGAGGQAQQLSAALASLQHRLRLGSSAAAASRSSQPVQLTGQAAQWAQQQQQQQEGSAAPAELCLGELCAASAAGQLAPAVASAQLGPALSSAVALLQLPTLSLSCSCSGGGAGGGSDAGSAAVLQGQAAGSSAEQPLAAAAFGGKLRVQVQLRAPQQQQQQLGARRGRGAGGSSGGSAGGSSSSKSRSGYWVALASSWLHQSSVDGSVQWRQRAVPQLLALRRISSPAAGSSGPSSAVLECAVPADFRPGMLQALEVWLLSDAVPGVDEHRLVWLRVEGAGGRALS